MYIEEMYKNAYIIIIKKIKSNLKYNTNKFYNDFNHILYCSYINIFSYRYYFPFFSFSVPIDVFT